MNKLLVKLPKNMQRDINNLFINIKIQAKTFCYGYYFSRVHEIISNTNFSVYLFGRSFFVLRPINTYRWCKGARVLSKNVIVLRIR